MMIHYIQVEVDTEIIIVAHVWQSVTAKSQFVMPDRPDHNGFQETMFIFLQTLNMEAEQ